MHIPNSSTTMRHLSLSLFLFFSLTHMHTHMHTPNNSSKKRGLARRGQARCLDSPATSATPMSPCAQTHTHTLLSQTKMWREQQPLGCLRDRCVACQSTDMLSCSKMQPICYHVVTCIICYHVVRCTTPLQICYHVVTCITPSHTMHTCVCLGSARNTRPQVACITPSHTMHTGSARNRRPQVV